MLALSTVQAAVFDVPHLFRVAARQHLGHQVVVVGRLVARMGALKRLPMVSKDLLEDIPVPRGGCYHRIAPSWGDQLVAVPRLYHASAASSTPHRPVYAHPHPLLSSETGATEIGKMNFPIRSSYNSSWSPLASRSFTRTAGEPTSGISRPRSTTWARSIRRKSRASTSISGPGLSGSCVARCAFPRRNRCTIW